MNSYLRYWQLFLIGIILIVYLSITIAFFPFVFGKPFDYAHATFLVGLTIIGLLIDHLRTNVYTSPIQDSEELAIALNTVLIDLNKLSDPGTLTIIHFSPTPGLFAAAALRNSQGITKFFRWLTLGKCAKAYSAYRNSLDKFVSKSGNKLNIALLSGKPSNPSSDINAFYKSFLKGVLCYEHERTQCLSDADEFYETLKNKAKANGVDINIRYIHKSWLEYVVDDSTDEYILILAAGNEISFLAGIGFHGKKFDLLTKPIFFKGEFTAMVHGLYTAMANNYVNSM